MSTRRRPDRHRTPAAAPAPAAASRPRPEPVPAPDAAAAAPRRFAVVGAGIAGVACARTLLQAGHAVTVFEREAAPGGRMAS